MKTLQKSILLALVSITLFSCRDLGLIEIPKYIGDRKWGNPKDASAFLVINGTKLHYRDQGPKDAPAIIAIHGIADSLHVWDEMASKLKNRFRFIRFDVPGFGLTGPTADGVYSAGIWAEILDELADRLRVDSFHLMGNSLGGFISWNYALRYPEKVKSLFLLDPAAFPVEKAPWIVELARYYPIRQITMSTTPRIIVSRAIYDVYGDDTKVTKEIIDRYYEMMLRQGNRYSYMDVFQKILSLKSIYPTELVDLKTKTMVVFGEKDEWIDPGQLKLWKKEVPHAKTNIYPGVGHTPQSEAADLVINDFLKFIKSSD